MVRAAALTAAFAVVTAGDLATQEPMTTAAVETAADPLFTSHAMLEITLEMDLRTVVKDVGDENQHHPATLTVWDTGGEHTVEIEVETRGHFRRNKRNCNFPPLRLAFPDSGTEGTPFAGQRELKLVVHCQDKKDEYEQYVLEEYLIYRVFNVLTDRSFRVRLARITYRDRVGKRDPLTKYAFLIEEHEAMAARNGCTVLEVNAHPLEFSPAETARMVLFQYMIGNTDFSIAYLHNVRLLMCPNYESVAVPYDFDWSGVIGTPYAKPDRKLPIRSVRDRLFRGFCRDEAVYQQAARELLERKDAIYDLYRTQDGLDPKRLERTLEYYDEFYEILDDPRKFRREILDRCRET